MAESLAPSSLLPRLEAAAETTRTITFVGSAGADGNEPVEWRRLHDDARAMAAALQRRGVGPGAHVALLGPTTRPYVTAIQAVWLAGGAVVALPLPLRLGSIDEFVEQTRRRIANADAALVVVDPALAEFVDPQPGDPPIVSFEDLAGGTADAYDRPADDPDALAILQFTSGSTADPKGVMLPHRCITANLDAIVEAAAIDPEADRAVSWLPLYHDMGLIGLLGAPMTAGFELVLGAPQDFLSRPACWMEWLSEFGATVTGGPNFAYALAARSLRRLERLDLSRWRLALNGAEPIDPAAVEGFLAAGAAHGLDPRSAFCVFGMAEATLAVTFPEPGTGMTVDTVDQRVLETDRYAAPVAGDRTEAVRRLPFLGRPLRGLDLRVCDPDTGEPMHPREVGEIEIRGASVTPGYYRHEGATADADGDGWLRTGDLGYLVDGELVVCGRLKDVIIVGGRNVFPEDVERAVAAVDGVRPGNVIAFGTEGRKGREALVVVAETKIETGTALREAVATRVADAVGVPPEDVVLVRPGTLPKTSSGKLQRSLCRARYLEDELAPV